mgnify:CR=1 FL=1
MSPERRSFTRACENPKSLSVCARKALRSGFTRSLVASPTWKKPGAGATIASAMTYSTERKIAGEKGRFGEGDLRGVRYMFTKSEYKDKIKTFAATYSAKSNHSRLVYKYKGPDTKVTAEAMRRWVSGMPAEAEQPSAAVIPGTTEWATPAACSCRVNGKSAELGVGSPLGWLWDTMIAAADARIASLKTSRG